MKTEKKSIYYTMLHFQNKVITDLLAMFDFFCLFNRIILCDVRMQSLCVVCVADENDMIKTVHINFSL